jgi:predicted lipoprotein with Yx(FWY)xxD motif
MKISILFRLNTLILLFALSWASCNEDDNPVQPGPLVQLANHSTYGDYLTDQNGRTLYFFANDALGQNTCTGGCEPLWPIFYAENLDAEKLGAGLEIADFGEISTASGVKQTTYKGWPLYYYAPVNGSANTPELPGETKGEGVNNVWFVAKPDYSIMLANAQLVGHDGKNYKSDFTEGDGKTLYFTDGQGLTLYTFSKDSSNLNKFTKSDFSNNSVWPIYETDKVVVPSSLDKSLFGAITVFGKTQLTYKGWPLYYFGQDALTRGNNKGVSFPSPGVWPVPTKEMPPAP